MRVLRCIGAATLIGLLALAIRYSLIQLFAASELQFVAWVAALLPLIAIDAWAFFCVSSRKQTPGWLGFALTAALAMLVNLPVIRSLYDIEPSSFLAHVLALAVTGIGMSWLGHQIADWMESSAVLETGQQPSPQSSYRALGVIGGFAVFMLVFILTAAPPV